MTQYEIRDPIYGFIPFNEWEKEIIDHPYFQRLRRIRQLSFTNMVYPGAVHTRFEHSLGVMHLTTLMYDSIVNNQKNIDILKDELDYQESGLKRDRQLIRLAALLHDVGHAPFSHGAEEIMPKKKANIAFKHEDYTSAVIKGPLKDTIEGHTTNKTNFDIKAEQIAALIEGNSRILGDRIFWKVLISSQLDADRGDYLLRDSHHIGVKYGVYDHNRLLYTLALGIDPDSSKVILGINEDGWHVAESIVLARYFMFTQVYFHKTRKAYDYHLKEASKQVLNNGTFPDPENIEEFLKYDDNKMLYLFRLKIDDPNCYSILNRNHIRVIYETPEIPNEKDEKEKENNKKLLMDSEIWFYEDKADALWYKLKGSDEGTDEISIIYDKGNVKPLETLSPAIKHMDHIKQIRLYVKPENKDKAMEVLESQKIVSSKSLP